MPVRLVDSHFRTDSELPFQRLFAEACVQIFKDYHYQSLKIDPTSVSLRRFFDIDITSTHPSTFCQLMTVLDFKLPNSKFNITSSAFNIPLHINIFPFAFEHFPMQLRIIHPHMFNYFQTFNWQSKQFKSMK